MNETDFIRRQLAAEHAHLREILHSVRTHTPPHPSQSLLRYIDWAGSRAVQLLSAHRTALQAAPQLRDELARVSQAAARAGDPDDPTLPAKAERLLALLEAWTQTLDAHAARTLRVGHWRQAAQLTADSILEERQLYTAARLATGLP